MRQRSDDFALRGVGSMKCEARSRCSHDLLFFRTSKLPKYSLCDRGGGLYGQRVHEHRRCSRHLAPRYAQRAAAASETL